MAKTAVLALGGNAIIKAGQKGTISQQFKNTGESLEGIVELVRQGYKLAITHGNGPQVGNLLRQQEAGEREGLPALPLGVLNAATEGTMSYMIEQSLQNCLLRHGLKKRVISILTQVEVDKNDPAMKNPTKFVGSRYYSAQEAQELNRSLAWILREDAGKGWRRVVPSPLPKKIIPSETIRELVHRGEIVIAVGGGGIPVYRKEDGCLEGIDAVIDKDHASSLLALNINADLFVILSDVEKVALNFGKPNQRDLDSLNIEEAKAFYKEGHFPPGSMGPKIKASINFLKRGGREVLITSIERIVDAIAGKTGTHITP